MKAIVAQQGNVALIDCPQPTIAAADDLILRVLMVGLCRTDLYVAQSKIDAKPNVVLGHEFCGEIVAVGEAVRHVSLGQRVGVMPLRKREDGTLAALGKDEDGAFADYIRVKAEQVYALPDTLSDRQGAYLEPVAASLAVLRAPIEPTMRGLVYGDNRIAGLTCAILRQAGFASITPHAHTETPSLAADYYDFIVETSPTSSALNVMVHAIKPGGLLVLKSRPYGAVEFPFTRIVEKELRVAGVHYAPFEDAIALLNSNALAVEEMFAEALPFEQAAAILAGEQPVQEQLKSFFRP